jgi:hypothetical protein
MINTQFQDVSHLISSVSNMSNLEPIEAKRPSPSAGLQWLGLDILSTFPKRAKITSLKAQSSSP